MKTFAFPVTYGAWGRILTFAPLNLTMQLMHRKTIIISFGNSNETMEISCITATTPGTYYSGYREYGKFIFVVPDYVKVIKSGYCGNSNSEAEKNNTSLLSTGGYFYNSIGFDFYKIYTRGEPEGVYMEQPEQLNEIKCVGFGEL